ncbi:MAG: GNAT family N-acetyltransferase [Agathobacter sp.]
MNQLEKFEFRDIERNETEQAVEIEQICFPPNEACYREHMSERIAAVPELFLVAIDKETGKNVMLLGLDVLPEYRGQGLARELLNQYAQREQKNGRRQLILTCLEEKVGMYLKFGLIDRGISNSTWGGEEWHEMTYPLAD